MNKNDIKLIIVLLVIILISFILYFVTKKDAIKAYVYYKDELIQEIDLSIDNTYQVTGENGEVVIEVKDNKIRVIKENSPYHLCSKQGFIDNSNQSLICLPNKIVITISGEEVDTVVR